MTTKEASTHYGSQLALARALGIWPTAVSQWGESPPQLRQYQIQCITEGKLKADVPPIGDVT